MQTHGVATLASERTSEYRHCAAHARDEQEEHRRSPHEELEPGEDHRDFEWHDGMLGGEVDLRLT